VPGLWNLMSMLASIYSLQHLFLQHLVLAFLSFNPAFFYFMIIAFYQEPR
jgi:hypothetical protein